VHITTGVTILFTIDIIFIPVLPEQRQITNAVCITVIVRFGFAIF